MVAPIPLNKAARQIALKHGIHAETLLLAVASNINWLEHHWTRVGAEPQPEGINVIERHVGQKKWTEAATIRQARRRPVPTAGVQYSTPRERVAGKTADEAAEGRCAGRVLRQPRPPVRRNRIGGLSRRSSEPPSQNFKLQSKSSCHKFKIAIPRCELAKSRWRSYLDGKRKRWLHTRICSSLWCANGCRITFVTRRQDLRRKTSSKHRSVLAPQRRFPTGHLTPRSSSRLARSAWSTAFRLRSQCCSMGRLPRRRVSRASSQLIP